jgi:hypothetical protein
MELIATFDSFLEDQLCEKKNKSAEKPSGDTCIISQGNEDETMTVFIEELLLERLKREIVQTSIYGQIAGAFLVEIKQRYGGALSFKQLDEIILYLEEFCLYNPNSRKMAEAIKNIEDQLAAGIIQSSD